MSDQKPVFGYWKLRGLGNYVRLLLEYTGTEYEDRHYDVGPAPDFDRSQWMDVKFTLGLDFPNLPYYIDGDVKLTQSLAILRYIARKHGLEGTTEQEKIRLDILANQAMDTVMAYIRLCYNPDFENVKGTFLADLPTVMKHYSDFLGDRQWFAGDKLTFGDFLIYEVLDQHLLIAPNCLKEFKNLDEFHKKFMALDKIKKYMASNRYIKSPMYSKMAQFGNK